MNKKKVLSIVIVVLLLICITTISVFADSSEYSSIGEAFNKNLVVILIVAAIGGIVTVVISIKAAKKKITTAVRQTVANNYVVEGSLPRLRPYATRCVPTKNWPRAYVLNIVLRTSRD